MQNLLLDTNVVSELIRDIADENVVAWFESCEETSIYTSVISHAEMLAGIAFLPKGKRKELLIKAVNQMFELRFTKKTLPFNSDCASFYAFIVASRRAAGKPIGIADAQIAAIAISQNLTLVTRNTKDFEQIQGLTVINPWLAPS